MLPRLVSIAEAVPSAASFAVGGGFTVAYPVLHRLECAQVGKNAFQIVVRHVPEVLRRIQH